MPLDRGAPDRAAHTGERQRSGVAPADRRALALDVRSVTGDAQDGAGQVTLRQETTGEDV
jgi:hypothetical protein